MKPESARRAARVVEIKAEIGYLEPHEREACSRCLHFRKRGDRPQGRCDSLRIDVAGKGVCNQFARASGGTKRVRAVTSYRGEATAGAKLTEAKVQQIRRMLDDGFRGCVIATHFGVSQMAVSNIKHGRQWRHVPRQPAE